MPLPLSFARDGFVSAAKIRHRKRLMIGMDGPPDTGKTEFAMSIPGYGIGICLDRGIDGCLDNPTPPHTRNENWAFKVIPVLLPTQATKEGYQKNWKEFYEWYRKALDNQDADAILVDGDSDSWELQRLAEFGRLTQVLPILYTSVNSARRAMYTRAWDSGKICVFTNKIKKAYETKFAADGVTPQKDGSGNDLRVWSGEYERQGFPDQDYLFHIQLSTMYTPERETEIKGRVKVIPAQYGIRINKCKRNNSLIGTELWGEDCCFRGLVQCVYPEVPLQEWGFAPNVVK
jgi:hypothetical protein